VPHACRTEAIKERLKQTNCHTKPTITWQVSTHVVCHPDGIKSHGMSAHTRRKQSTAWQASGAALQFCTASVDSDVQAYVACGAQETQLTAMQRSEKLCARGDKAANHPEKCSHANWVHMNLNNGTNEHDMKIELAAQSCVMNSQRHLHTCTYAFFFLAFWWIQIACVS